MSLVFSSFILYLCCWCTNITLLMGRSFSHDNLSVNKKKLLTAGIIATGGSLFFIDHSRAAGWSNISQASRDLPPLYGEPIFQFPPKLWSNYLSLDLWPYGIVGLFLMILGLMAFNKNIYTGDCIFLCCSFVLF